MTLNYRKIYEQAFGIIPKDKDGRTYEIHHIDGNHKNNSPENLKPVSIQEHYDIHYKQYDWTACFLIALRMKVSPEEISNLSKKSNLERIANGIHNFQTRSDGTSQAADRVASGIHHFLGKNNPSHQRLVNGNHNFLDKDFHRQTAEKRRKNGTDYFITNNPSKIKIMCPYCLKMGGAPQMKQWHFDKCKDKK